MTVSGYAKDVLVSADWAKAHLDDPSIRFVEVDVDTTAYDQSHIPGAVGWNWTSQLADGVRRDIASREEFSALLSQGCIGPETQIVLAMGDWLVWVDGDSRKVIRRVRARAKVADVVVEGPKLVARLEDGLTQAFDAATGEAKVAAAMLRFPVITVLPCNVLVPDPEILSRL